MPLPPVQGPSHARLTDMNPPQGRGSVGCTVMGVGGKGSGDPRPASQRGSPRGPGRPSWGPVAERPPFGTPTSSLSGALGCVHHQGETPGEREGGQGHGSQGRLFRAAWASRARGTRDPPGRPKRPEPGSPSRWKLTAAALTPGTGPCQRLISPICVPFPSHLGTTAPGCREPSPGDGRHAGPSLGDPPPFLPPELFLARAPRRSQPPPGLTPQLGAIWPGGGGWGRPAYISPVLGVLAP